MIDTIKDKEGKCIAYCEWSLRDSLGFEKKDGEYIWINDMWIHEKERGNGMIKKFITSIEPKVPSARHIYWKRDKHNGRLSQYTERQFLKLRGV